MPDRRFYIYILANKRNGTLYVGVTGDLIRRVYQHREGTTGGFTHKYGVKRLVYFEVCEDAYEAIRREKQLKAWKRNWKLELIEKSNPDWRDLYDELVS